MEFRAADPITAKGWLQAFKSLQDGATVMKVLIRSLVWNELRVLVCAGT